MPFLKTIRHSLLANSPIRNKKSFSANSQLAKWQNSGFTLLELLVTITIIGILSTIALASFNAAQEKARDSVRKSDLAQLKKAMQLVRNDCIGSAYYPVITGADNFIQYTNLGTYLADSDLKYMSSAPKDPKNSAPQKYAYNTSLGTGTANKCPSEISVGDYDKDGATDYAIWSKLERTSDNDSTVSKSKCTNKPGNATWNAAGVPGFYVVCNE